MHLSNEQEIEVNIKELFDAMIKKIWIIIIVGLLCAGVTGLISKFVLKPVYTSATKIYVINRQNKTMTTYSDLQTGSQLTQDYKVLVKSRPVTEQVLHELNLAMTHEELISRITVNTPSDTRILEIVVESSNPQLAKELADSIADVSSERMISIMEMEKVNIVEPANLPTKPSSPNTLFYAIIGGLSGGFLTIFAILLFFISDDTIKSYEDIEKYLGVTALGMIPYEKMDSQEKDRKLKRRAQKKTKREKVLNDKVKEEFAANEAYKALRTNLQFCGKELKTICVTSCSPNEGKTVISFRLAAAIAETGNKVLFIDADLRKSVILGRLGVNGEVYGLSQYLSGMNSVDDIINKTNLEHVDIIHTGPIPPNPSELLGSEDFYQLIQMLKEIYDYIIVDTPPLGVVIDSASVAKCCDGTIMIVESKNISYKLAQRVLKQLEKGKCRVLGAVLNKVNMNVKGYYAGYY